jgi:hypothetical protein
MAPDDIPVANPASETERKPKLGNPSGCSIGPESETPGGPEAPGETLETPGRPGKVSGKASGGMAASDPPKPPGQPPELPDLDPDKPTPIEEPPSPIPVPPNDPPPPIIALLCASAMRCG